MDIVCYVFDGITALDVVGPYEVLARLPGATVKFVGEQKETIRTDNQVLGISADYARAEITAADILVMPGGFATRNLEGDTALLDWIRAIDETTTWTTSVCTGSMLLAAAGLLEGKEATTHWASLDRLREYGAVPSTTRVVPQGKYVTAAGVSSGIDMALTLAGLVAGQDIAEAIQLSIEYDPQPPYDSGSVAKAKQPVLDLVTAVIEERQREVSGV